MSSTPLRRALGALALLLAVVVAGSACTRTVVGQASPDAGGVKKNAAPSDLPIENGNGSKIDQLVANSLDDVMTYWDEQFKKTFGKSMPKLEGGVHAYEPDQAEPIPCFADNEKQYAANNAFYCPTEDAIAYDRKFLTQLVQEFGEFIVPLVFAHEFGHAIQDRVGVQSDKSIAWEGQADCYAGVFTQAAVDGTAHFKATDADLDTVLGGYLMLRDEPGASADDQMAHGSAFDRVSAFQEGFNDGGKHCYTSFGNDREYTEIAYTSTDKANEGNLPYDETLQTIPPAMNAFGQAVIGDSWQDVAASGFSGASAKCDGEPSKEQVFYCPADTTVHYAETKLVQQSYDKFGDFAAMAAVGMGYAAAIQDESGAKTTGKKPFEQRLCLVGAFAGGAFEATVSNKPSPTSGNLKLSAGDLDEAVMLLIAIGEDDAFLQTYGLDPFDRINTFREAVVAGRDDPEGAAKSCLG